MHRSTRPARNRRLLSRRYVFCVVCLATFLLGTLVWRPPEGSVHVRTNINQTLSSSLASDSTPARSADALLDAFVQAVNQRPPGASPMSQPQVVRAASTATDSVNADGSAGRVLLTATAVNSRRETTIKLNYVSHSASEAMAVADGLSRQYVDFVTRRLGTAAASHISTNQDDLVARFQEIAESAERHLHDFVASYLDRPADREDSEQPDRTPVATSNAPLASARASVGIPPGPIPPGAIHSERNDHGTVQVSPYGAEASPSSVVETDDPAAALWYATRKQLNREENRLSRMLVDLQESHPRVQQLRFDLAQLRSELEQMDAPPPGNSVLSAAMPPTVDVPQEAHSSVPVESVTTVPQPNQRPEPPSIVSAGPQEQDREKYEQLQDQMKQARQQYEQARRDERQAQREYLATQLQDISVIRLEPARVVGVFRPAGTFRWGCLGLLGIGSGTVISLLFGRHQKEFVADAKQASQMIPSPVLAQIPYSPKILNTET